MSWWQERAAAYTDMLPFWAYLGPIWERAHNYFNLTCLFSLLYNEEGWTRDLWAPVPNHMPGFFKPCRWFKPFGCGVVLSQSTGRCWVAEGFWNGPRNPLFYYFFAKCHPRVPNSCAYCQQKVLGRKCLIFFLSVPTSCLVSCTQEEGLLDGFLLLEKWILKLKMDS